MIKPDRKRATEFTGSGESVVHVSGNIIFVSADASRGSSCTAIVVVGKEARCATSQTRVYPNASGSDARFASNLHFHPSSSYSPAPKSSSLQTTSRHVGGSSVGHWVKIPGFHEPSCRPEDCILLGTGDEVVLGGSGPERPCEAGREAQYLTEHCSDCDRIHLGPILVCHHTRQL